MLCDDLDGWGGEGVGERSKRERTFGIYIYIADSLHCTTDTNTTLSSNFTPIKKREDAIIKFKCDILIFIPHNNKDNYSIREF